MKRTILLSLALLGAVSATMAQCTPGTDFQGTGLTLSATSFDPVYACTECGDHVRVISVQTFADTMLSIEINPDTPPLDVTVFADYFRLDSIAGLPSGLTYTTDAAFDTTYDAVTDPFGYWINPGDTASGFTNTTGCISIEGDAAAWTAAIGGGPNNDGIYPLTIFIDARAAGFDPEAISDYVGYNTWLTEMGILLDAFGDTNFTVNGIKLLGPSLQVIQSGVGIEDREKEMTLSVYPNPASNVVNLAFDAESASKGTLLVHNSLGRSVATETLTIGAGRNNHMFDCSDLAVGLYQFTIEYDGHALSRKILVE